MRKVTEVATDRSEDNEEIIQCEFLAPTLFQLGIETERGGKNFERYGNDVASYHRSDPGALIRRHCDKGEEYSMGLLG